MKLKLSYNLPSAIMLSWKRINQSIFFVGVPEIQNSKKPIDFVQIEKSSLKTICKNVKCYVNV